MIIASWKDVSERCFTRVVPSCAERMVTIYSQHCNFWEFMLATALPNDPSRPWYAEELRTGRINLAHALKEWEENPNGEYWNGWPLTG